MASKRMISSSLPKSKKMRRLKDDTTRLLFYMLCVSCDDDGKMDADPEDIRADLFGGRDEIKIQDVNKMLTDCAQVGLIMFYECKTTGQKYLEIINWKDHNKIPKDRHKPSKIPCYSNSLHNLLTFCQHNVNKCTHRVVKSSIEESSIEENSINTLSGKKPDHVICKDIVDDLNQKAGTSYRYKSKKTKSLINARINEGFTVEDFFKVHDNKISEWLNTDMAKFLRPETLYGNKFEGYLNQKQKDNSISDITRGNLIGAKDVLDKIDRGEL